MKPRAFELVRVLVVATGAMLASCHTWGFFRPVEVAPNQASVAGEGLRWSDLNQGGGAEVVAGSRVSVHYTGWLEDGTKFDSSLDRGRPFEFVVGEGAVVPGWDEAMLGMHVGSARRIVIPPELAYGAKGHAEIIPPNATLVLEVELLAVD